MEHMYSFKNSLSALCFSSTRLSFQDAAGQEARELGRMFTEHNIEGDRQSAGQQDDQEENETLASQLPMRRRK